MVVKTLFSPRCTICVHDDCAIMNLALVKGAPVDAIAKRFPGCSSHALRRHYKNHLPQSVRERLAVQGLAGIVGKGISAANVVEGENALLLPQLIAIKTSLMGAIAAAEREPQGGFLMSSLVGRLTRLLALESQLLGRISSGSTTNVTNYIQSDSFIRIQSALIRALRPYPEAARAVSAALLAIESEPKEIEVIDVTSTTISGTERVDATSMAEAATATEVVLLPAVVRSDPAVIRTEECVDGRTTER